MYDMDHRDNISEDSGHYCGGSPQLLSPCLGRYSLIIPTLSESQSGFSKNEGCGLEDLHDCIKNVEVEAGASNFGKLP